MCVCVCVCKQVENLGTENNVRAGTHARTHKQLTWWLPSDSMMAKSVCTTVQTRWREPVTATCVVVLPPLICNEGTFPKLKTKKTNLDASRCFSLSLFSLNAQAGSCCFCFCCCFCFGVRIDVCVCVKAVGDARGCCCFQEKKKKKEREKKERRSFSLFFFFLFAFLFSLTQTQQPDVC